jgi:D-glycero-D-manno-heptose 1,7-bisphosphate phosphatase
MSLFTINNNWTLFLDRDGVINEEQHLSYVNTWDDFIFYAGVKEAIKIFAARFKYIIVITNQRGVGRGITSIENLQLIHQHMKAAVSKSGGRIDAIYFCPDIDNASPNRKPQTGMALQAKHDFKEIDFTRSVMVGNTFSDMQFGRNIGAKTIFIPSTIKDADPYDERIDAMFNSLYDFAKSL